MKKVYLAGPFFNDNQNQLLDFIENRIEHNKFDLRSPRKIFICPADAPLEVRASTFKGNLKEICDCDFVVAVMDFLMPEGRELRVCEEINKPQLLDAAGVKAPPTEGQIKAGPPLRLPDTGTIWELGYAYAMGKPIVALKFQDNKKINLMLAMTAHLYCLTPDDFEDCLRHIAAFNKLPEGKAWAGKVI